MELKTVFVDRGSDLSTTQYLLKSCTDPQLLKALDSHKPTKVMKQVAVHGKNGTFTRMQEVNADEVQSADQRVHHDDPEVDSTNNKIENHKRNSERKGLSPIESADKAPAFFKENKIVIPPAWKHIYVSNDPNTKIWATGLDSKNRVQTVYNPEYRAKRTSEKFGRISNLLQVRDKLVNTINKIKNEDVKDCLTLIYAMGLRPGSTRNTQAKVEAIGATTLRGEHVVEENGKVYLRFIGKKGVNQDHEVTDKKLAKMLLKRKQDHGNKGNLFNATDKHLRDALEPLGVHPKDLRTLLATGSALDVLKDIPAPTSVKEFNKIRNQVGDHVCAKLGNTRNMSLTSYIDPQVFKDWAPKLYEQWEQKTKKSTKGDKNNEAA